MKERLLAFDFVRAVCALIIVTFHYSSHLNSRDFLPLYVNGSVSWGSTAVTVFFMISGCMLYYNNPEIKLSGLKKYWLKRWKAIFPIYYIAFIFLFAVNAIRHGKIFYKGNPALLILSALGLDGYFLYRIDNYYIIGEWFLGAIIILYALYPLLLRFFNKSEIITTVIVFIAYIAALTQDWFEISIDTNLFSCLISFEAGMLIIKRIDYLKNIKFLFISTAGMIILCTVKLPFNSNVLNHISGLFLFVILYNIGEVIMQNYTANKIISELSRLSYAVFLTHHITIYVILSIIQPTESAQVIGILLFITALTVFESEILINVIPVCRKALAKINSYIQPEHK